MVNRTTDQLGHRDQVVDASIPKDGATVEAMKQVVIVGLAGEPSVIQEHILQTLAAFRLMCYSNGSASLQNGCNCAKASGLHGWLPAMQRVVVVEECRGEGVVG